MYLFIFSLTKIKWSITSIIGIILIIKIINLIYHNAMFIAIDVSVVDSVFVFAVFFINIVKL